jgi:hypothetical protein
MKGRIIMARQSHSRDPHDTAQATPHVTKDQQRQHRTGEFEFEWDASLREGNRTDRTPENTGRSSKRRRIALACNVCRARKSKVILRHP